MTRQEFIKKALEFRREGKSYASDLSCRDIHPEDCSGCPYSENIFACHDMYTDDLLDRVIELEDVVQVFSGMEKGEHHETNLEHYYEEGNKGWNQTELVPVIWFKRECLDQYENMKKGDFVKWLLEAYEELPKKYRMSKLCYDIIKRYVGTCANPNVILKNTALYDVLYLLDFYEESWKEIRLEELLENAEVIDSEID